MANIYCVLSILAAVSCWCDGAINDVVANVCCDDQIKEISTSIYFSQSSWSEVCVVLCYDNCGLLTGIQLH